MSIHMLRFEVVLPEDTKLRVIGRRHEVNNVALAWPDRVY